ncbi:ion channel [Alicyclobacillus sp. SO9]|uniref:ion channel n=1 Tax=Alicyclobacillus sp. SO9 TaxID=2665646 RepID=UPI00351C1FC0
MFRTKIFLYTATQGIPPSQSNVLNYIYFNTVSYFGLGYGDLIPASLLARMITIAELMINFINTLLIITFSLSEEVSPSPKEPRKSTILRQIYGFSYSIIIAGLTVYILVPAIRAPANLHEYRWISITHMKVQEVSRSRQPQNVTNN